MSEKVKFLLVVSALAAAVDGGHQIAFHEKNPLHPNGEAFVTSPKKPVKVADTPAVREKIASKWLKEVDEAEAEETELGYFEGDTVESLLARYKGKREQFFELAGEFGIEAKQNQSNMAIATAIIEAAEKDGTNEG